MGYDRNDLFFFLLFLNTSGDFLFPLTTSISTYDARNTLNKLLELLPQFLDHWRRLGQREDGLDSLLDNLLNLVAFLIITPVLVTISPPERTTTAWRCWLICWLLLSFESKCRLV